MVREVGLSFEKGSRRAKGSRRISKSKKDPVNRAEDGSSCTGTGGSWRVRRRRRVHTGCAKVGKEVCWRGSGKGVLGRK